MGKLLWLYKNMKNCSFDKWAFLIYNINIFANDLQNRKHFLGDVIMKLTKKRQEVLNLVQSSSMPVNAKILKSQVDFDLSTVYRALDFLEKNNYIFSFDFENEKYYFKEENANFFICDSCKHIETVPEFSNEETEKEKSELKKQGFLLLSHLSIFKGKCNDCD